MKKIVYKACILALMIGGGLGYVLGEYDGDIIEPTAKYMKDRKIDYSSMSEDEICWKIHPSEAREDRTGFPGLHPTPAQDIFQGVERVAVIFETKNEWSRYHIACLDGNVKEGCAYRDVAISVKKKREKTEASNGEYSPSNLFPAVELAVKDLLSCQKKEAPITLHYLPTDDIFYQKGTLAISVEISPPHSHKKISFGASIYRPDMGFRSISTQNVYWEEYDYDPEKIEDFKNNLTKHVRKILHK